MQLSALFRLGFPTAPALLCLNLAAYGNSQAHSTKGTPSPLRALTACRSTVSGSLSLPSRGSFHLSFTVLLHYRSSGSILAWRVVPPASLRVPRVRRYSGYDPPSSSFTYRSLTFSGVLSHTLRLDLVGFRSSSTPRVFLPAVWPNALSLATTRAISFDYSSSPYLDVSVREVPLPDLWIQSGIYGSSP